MSYSGNPSLSSEVKQRILSTFDQTLELAQEGNRQEALLGCDFVLRMDPQFQPAHLLQDRLRSTAGPVPVDDLRGGSAAPDDPFADLDGLSFDLPDLLPDGGGAGGPGLRAELQSLLEQHRFQDLMTRAQRDQAAVMADPELQRIVGVAQERMEAEPYVLKFLASARQALQSGDAAEAARLLDKARSLDSAHPGITELDRLRAAGPAPRPIAPTTTAMPIPPPAPPASVFDFPSPAQTVAMPSSLAFGGGDSESDRRIRELLDEGQAAFDGGDPQGAIDAWSRIFLIDIDHQEASRRIEMARKAKAETERQVEEIFHDGVARMEAGDTHAARRAFEQVLQLQPGYFAAREYLQQLDSGAAAAGSKGLAAFPSAAPVPVPAMPAPSRAAAAGHDLKEEILVPPEPFGAEAPAERKPARKAGPAARRDGGRARRLFLLVGGAVLLLAAAAAWYFLQNREEVFPNSQEATAAAPTAGKADPIARAERLHKQGKTAIALSQLKRVPQTDPHYAQAQKLIGEWGGTPSTPGGAPAGTPAPAGAVASAFAGAPDVAAKRDALMAEARQSLAAQSYIKALGSLEAADKIAKLDGADAQLLADTRQRLEPLSRQIEGFRQHEWEVILPDLWRMHESEPGNRDVTQMIVDSYYNLAVRDLQRADAVKAADKLKEAVTLLPTDEALKRHMVFAQTYQERPKDLLYQIYVKYLPFR
jgi:tetratricopeptide (TPR) repeat protein